MSGSATLDADDILVRQHADEAELAARQALDLRAVEINRLAAVVESSDDAIISKTLDGIIVTWNQGAERIFGYKPEEAIGRPVTMLMPPDHVDEEPSILARLRRGERVDHYETIRQHKNGARIHISLSISPIRDAEGRIVGASKIARDITRQKRTEMALRASEQRFRITADSAPALIWMTDVSKGCIWFNRSWLDFTRRAMAQDLGFGWTGIVHPDDLDALLQLYDRSFAARQPYRIEIRLRRHDGEWRWMVSTAVPLFEGGESTQFSGYVGSMIDITDMRRAAAERESLLEAERAARNESERLGRMKDEFLATLSHELRTPLNAVLGWTILLRRLTPGSPDHSKGLETIERNARAQARIIEDLLDMSRIISGNVQLDIKPVNPRSVVEAAVDALRPSAAAKGLRLVTRLDQETGLVCADANRLQQVMWNVLTNAAKFTPAGGHIEVSLKRLYNEAEIQVRDSGIGIPREFLPHVFDRFRQADASITREQGGLGLGLAIVKHLVELHGGSVRAQSEGEGKGSAFFVRLPLYAATTDPEEPLVDEADRSVDLECAELPLLASLVVLVVDDQADAHELIGNFVTDRSGQVQLAESAEQALGILRNQHVDIVISDIGMPGIDGYELMRRIRALPGTVSRIPAIALTAYARTVDRQRALLAGFQMHLPKPVEPRELIAGIATLVNLSR